MATFTAELMTNGVKHTFPAAFTASSPFDFVLENAAPPYGGIFTVSEGSRDIEVILSVAGTTEDRKSSAGPSSPAVVGTVGSAGPPGVEVRFDVCVPSGSVASCFAQGDSGSFGLPFEGTIGDLPTSHQVAGSTPTIFFLEDAHDSVHATFTLQPYTGQNLVGQLYVNGELKETESSAHDVVIKHDL